MDSSKSGKEVQKKEPEYDEDGLYIGMHIFIYYKYYKYYIYLDFYLWDIELIVICCIVKGQYSNIWEDGGEQWRGIVIFSTLLLGTFTIIFHV